MKAKREALGRRCRIGLGGVEAVLIALLANASSALASGPPSPPPAPHMVPATGGLLVVGGLVGYGIYRLRKRK